MNISGLKSIKGQLIIGLISIIYLVIVGFFIGLKPEHFFIVILYNMLYNAGGKARKLISAFTIFILFGVIYDLMKIYPNYMVNKIDVSHIYHFEKSNFGIHSNGKLLTLNEYFSGKDNSFLDIFTGFFYLNWMSVPIIFGVYMYIKNKREFLCFSLAFIVVNLIGFIICYIHPAAPPWYVATYGFHIHPDIMGNPAGFIRFDKLLNTHIFETIYSRNSNVFAAFPSLHVTYPLIVLFYALKNKLGKINYFFLFFMLGMWFSAVYNSHHYVIDVISGILCAIFGILIFELSINKVEFLKKWILNYEKAIR